MMRGLMVFKAYLAGYRKEKTKVLIKIIMKILE
jgi:hypothetical protein